MRTTPGQDTGELTARQAQVLELAANGYNSYQIAEELVLSRDTVNGHIKHARAALGADTIAHAVALALLTGQIEYPERRR